MTRKFYLVCVAFAILASISIIGYNRISLADIDDLTMANIEALSRDEMAHPSGPLDCSYEREEVVCTVRLSADMASKFLGFKFIDADVDGTLYAVGNECVSGGTKTCEPLRCNTIYEIFFGKTN